MKDVVVETRFDCVGRSGEIIRLTVAIGDRHDVSVSSGKSDVGFYVEIDPIMPRRKQVGVDSFSAMCCCIELVRKALKIFVAHGGTVFFVDTKSPIDLDDFAFQPVIGLLHEKYLDDSSEI